MNSSYTYTQTGTPPNPILLIAGLIIIILAIIGGWKIFTKAGKPGWAILIPIYNIYILLKIAGQSGWWILLYLIPYVNIIMAIVIGVYLAKAFGRSALFGIFLLGLFAPIGYIILGFGNSKYVGSKASILAAQTATPPVTT